ncbi:MAG: hypothetical protein JO256_02300 [Alphaproteobacteria bacterium]|nr:hypothetical protein [Alphaproteobacteria bacterium]
MMRWLIPLLLCLPSCAEAGAWTQDRGKWQIISGAIASEADRSFGTTTPITFRRALFQAYAEYGFRDNITLVATAESASVRVVQSGTPFRAVDNAFGAAARFRLDKYLHLGAGNILSLEAGWRVAGAFNFAISANRSMGGQGGELRLLYGRSFKLAGRDGFVDIETGYDFLTGPRPDEMPLDLTAGWWIGKNHMLMAQSFNLLSQAGATPAWPAFNSHKLQLSWVWRRSPRSLYQLGVFFSPAGNNALVEDGFSFSLWRRF